ncbi:MAG: hypothetical protein E7056_08050 [Lentisphaerae bacterium]|nr:hypothetical protein [Lentisphaerota bacterium]
MKIACPECGQHYEVDSNMLDRHYRCKECKAFFLGLNAKPVKSIQFKSKDDGADNADGKAAESAGNAVTENAEKEVKSSDGGSEKNTADKATAKLQLDEELAEDKKADDYLPLKPIKPVNIAVIAALTLAVLTLIMGIVCNVRVSALNAKLPEAGKSVEALADQVERLDQGTLTIVGELGRIKEQLDMMARNVEAAKTADNKLKKDLQDTVERIEQLEQKSILLIRQTSQMAEMLEKIEKSSIEVNSGNSDSDSSEDKSRRRVRVRR